MYASKIPGGALRGEDSKQEAMFSYVSPERRVTLGGDKNYDTRDFVPACRDAHYAAPSAERRPPVERD